MKQAAEEEEGGRLTIMGFNRVAKFSHGEGGVVRLVV